MALKYCDYIADVIKKSLCADEGLVTEVGHIQMDLHPEEGYFVSTKKTIPVKDVNGTSYIVTVEEDLSNKNVPKDGEIADLLVELAKGSVRDSLTLSDQAISHCDGNLTEELISKLHGVLDLSSTTKLFDAMFKNDIATVVEELKRYQSLDVNYEILFDRSLGFLHEKIVNSTLSGDHTTQDLHLYYQFFSNGLVDAKHTGKTKDCFDISVLRCLTFSDQFKSDSKKKPNLKETKITKSQANFEEKNNPKKEITFEEVGAENFRESVEEKKLTPTNWLEVFDKTDLVGPSRAFFSNLQLEKVKEDTIYFIGAEMFAERINKENVQNLIDSLKRLNFPEYKVEIESTEKAKNTPSSKWEQQRKKDIEIFKKEIIDSDLLANLKNKFGEDIDEDKIMVIDHEE